MTSGYKRGILNHHLAKVCARLLAVRVAFAYQPHYGKAWSDITVPPKHAATLALICDQLGSDPL